MRLVLCFEVNQKQAEVASQAPALLVLLPYTRRTPMSSKRKERSGLADASPSSATTRPGASGFPGYVGFYLDQGPDRGNEVQAVQQPREVPLHYPRWQLLIAVQPCRRWGEV